MNTAMGILEALNGGGIDDSAKEAFLKNQPVITGCGGLDEFYSVLRGENYTEISEKLGGLMSVTYSPSMIQTAISDMVDKPGRQGGCAGPCHRVPERDSRQC